MELARLGFRLRRRAEKRRARGRRPDGDGWRRLTNAVGRWRWLAVIVPTLATLALAAPALDSARHG